MGLTLREAPVEIPWVKDYDTIKGEGPARWAKRFDVSNWGLFAAYEAGTRVGGAVIAFNTAGVNMLEGRSDLAVLWDLRVRPEVRRTGIGSELFTATETWARASGCRSLKVETQNINVPACCFTGDRAAPSARWTDLPIQTFRTRFSSSGSSNFEIRHQRSAGIRLRYDLSDAQND